MNKIVLTGGGTAGHVTLNIKLIPLFQEAGWNVSYIGSKDGIEKEMIKQLKDVNYYEIHTGKLRRYITLKNLTDIPKLIYGTYTSYKILKDIKPNVIFSKGGFVSVPVVVAGNILSIKTILHESDMIIGLANKIALRFADKMYSVFELNIPKSVKIGAIVDGNISSTNSLFKEQADKKNLLVMGGSLGAESINKFVEQNIEKLLEEYNILHITGKGKGNNLRFDNYACIEYCSSGIEGQMRNCDLVLSRAGSNAIYEILYAKKISILVPLPLSSSRGDQLKNAEYFKQKGYSEVIYDEDLCLETFMEKVNVINLEQYQYNERIRNQNECIELKEFFKNLENEIFSKKR